MDHRALNNALEPGGRLGVVAAIDNEIVEFTLDVAGQVAAQLVDIDAAGAHDGGGVLVVHQGQQQVLERRVLVMTLVCEGERAMERLLETSRESWHSFGSSRYFPGVDFTSF